MCAKLTELHVSELLECADVVCWDFPNIRHRTSSLAGDDVLAQVDLRARRATPLGRHVLTNLVATCCTLDAEVDAAVCRDGLCTDSQHASHAKCHVMRKMMCKLMQQTTRQLMQCSMDHAHTRITICTLFHKVPFSLFAAIRLDREWGTHVTLIISVSSFRNMFAQTICIVANQTAEALCYVFPSESDCSSHAVSVRCDQRKHVW